MLHVERVRAAERGDPSPPPPTSAPGQPSSREAWTTSFPSPMEGGRDRVGSPPPPVRVPPGAVTADRRRTSQQPNRAARTPPDEEVEETVPSRRIRPHGARAAERRGVGSTLRRSPAAMPCARGAERRWAGPRRPNRSRGTSPARYQCRGPKETGWSRGVSEARS